MTGEILLFELQSCTVLPHTLLWVLSQMFRELCKCGVHHAMHRSHFLTKSYVSFIMVEERS